MLDLSSLQKACASLERGLNYATDRFSSGLVNSDEAEILKAAVIQNFEFTYELCWKFMKRWVDVNYSESMTAGLSRRQLFRLAIENRLMDDFDRWLRYHELRNLTSHTYDRDVADEIFEAAGDFLKDAVDLLGRLEAKND